MSGRALCVSTAVCHGAEDATTAEVYQGLCRAAAPVRDRMGEIPGGRGSRRAVCTAANMVARPLTPVPAQQGPATLSLPTNRPTRRRQGTATKCVGFATASAPVRQAHVHVHGRTLLGMRGDQPIGGNVPR